MRAAYASSALEDIPVDFFADPDGCWDYDQLARVAGFDQAWGQLSIGALTEPYSGFPDGAAVVMFTNADQCVVALIDCLAGGADHVVGSSVVGSSVVGSSVVGSNVAGGNVARGNVAGGNVAANGAGANGRDAWASSHGQVRGSAGHGSAALRNDVAA